MEILRKCVEFMNVAPNSLPPRNGGRVTVVAEGRVNPGEVSGDGKSVVFGEFEPGEGESVYRWSGNETVKLNTDGHSSYQARCNSDASVVTYHRYSLLDASDETGNWDIARWQDGQAQVVAGTPDDEMSPDIDDSGETIVYDRTDDPTKTASIEVWRDGQTERLAEGDFADLFPELSGNGERIVWRRDLSQLYLRDQDGVNKPIATRGEGAASVMLDQKGKKILYTAEDKNGDQDIYLADISNGTTTTVAALKGVDEYQGYLSGDGNSVVYTGIDRRKDVPDMNVYVWRDGKTEQLTWDDGGLNTGASVSHNGDAISWFWIDKNDTSHRKVLLWERDQEG